MTAPEFDVRWSRPGDEPDIRALIGSVAMPGAVAVRFSREPDYFLGASIMGDPCDVLVARHQPDGQLAGIACRAESKAFVNGREEKLGYIGQIRIAQEFRGRWLVNTGAEMFREASQAGMLYFGVIASDNPRARLLLAGSRPPAGLHVRHISGITTCAILLRPVRERRLPGIEVTPGTPETLAEIVNFLRENGPGRQFFPVYSLEDFTGGYRLRGLSPEDIFVARRGGKIAGVMAVWDQSAYKQDIIDSYGPALRRLRPVYDLAARLLRASPLTPSGQVMPLVFAACICVAGDPEAAVMQALLQACLKNAYARGKAYLMLGLADGDPLLPVVKRTLHVTYHSDLYAFSWDGGVVDRVDGRIPYIEIATL